MPPLARATEQSVARRPLLALKRQVRYARHDMAIEAPDQDGVHRLRSHKNRNPRRDLFVSYRSDPREPGIGPVLLVDHEGTSVVAAELPPAPPGKTVMHPVCLPAKAGPMSVRGPAGSETPGVADVRVYELGPLVFSVVLAVRWARRQLGAPSRLPGRVVRAGRHLRSGGVKAVRAQLLRGETTAQRREMRARARAMALGPSGPTTIAPVDRAALLAERKRAMAETFTEELTTLLGGDDRVTLPRAASPSISIVLVLYGRAELTLACLRSIAEHAGDDVEVLVVDNASRDRTRDLMARVDGAIHIENESNVGYLLAVNQAVKHANGDAVLLFNNDARLREGALAAAAKVLAEEGVGVVGGPLVLADGWLQEAGSIVYADGSCEGFGRDRDPGDPEMHFRRDVDFVSGAFMLTRRSLWDQLGGYDEAFVPAYYEDVDYCVRAWQAGWRVVYEPNAVADHFEYGSAADPEWARERMRTNRAIFVERHASWLAEQPERGGPSHVVRSRERRTGVLIIDDRVPLPHLGSGGPRMAAFARTLEELGYPVTFYSKLPTEATWAEVHDALSPTIEVAGFDDLSGLEAFVADRAGAFEAVVISRSHNAERIAPLLDKMRPSLGDAVIVYDAEALTTNRVVARRAVEGAPVAERDVELMVAEEASHAAFADRIIAVSEAEAVSFRRHTGASVEVLGHGVRVKPGLRPFEERTGLLYVGTLTDEQSPNVDGLLWFLDEVFPRAVAMLADAGLRDVGLTVVGRATALTVLSRRTPGVRLAGTIDDLGEAYDSARLFIAPTRFAAGIPLKVVDAAAAGVPCVTTDLLSAQLGWRHEHELLSSRVDGREFAAECARLYVQQELWRRVRDGALARVTSEHSLETLRERARSLIAPVAGAGGDGLVEGTSR